MHAVRGQVQQIVEQVHAGRAQAEGQESHAGVDDRGRVEEAVRGQQRYQHQQVLQPLVDAQRLDPGQQATVLRRQVGQHLGLPGRRADEPRTVVDHDRTTGMRPHLQVDLAVAHVVEAALTEAFGQRMALVATGQVGVAIAGHDFLEQAQVVGDGLHQQAVRGGAQHARPLRGGAQDLQHTLVVGQGLCRELYARGQLALHVGLATQQPERNQEQVERVVGKQRQQRFVQDVRAKQGAVEVDAEGAWRGHCGRASWQRMA